MRLFIIALVVLNACTGSKDDTGHRPTDTSDTHGDSDTGGDSDTDSGLDTDTEDTGPAECDRGILWIDVSCAETFCCGVHEDGCAECWGNEINWKKMHKYWYDYGDDTPPCESFKEIHLVHGSTGYPTQHACGILEDDSVTCWGKNNTGQADAPPEPMRSLDVGDYYSIGILMDGTLVSWGLDELMFLPEGSFIQVDATNAYQAVALREDGALVPITAPGGFDIEFPTGQFIDVSTYFSWGCAIQNDGAVVCWGRDDFVEPVPKGEFTDVCVGAVAACALDTGGYASCWGSGEHLKEWEVPSIPMRVISCGYLNACGVTTEGGIVCWGRNNYGQNNVPS